MLKGSNTFDFVCTMVLFGKCMYVVRFNKFGSKHVTPLLISCCKHALSCAEMVGLNGTWPSIIWKPGACPFDLLTNSSHHLFCSHVVRQWTVCKQGCLDAHKFFLCRRSRNRGQCGLLENLDGLSKYAPVYGGFDVKYCWCYERKSANWLFTKSHISFNTNILTL